MATSDHETKCVLLASAADGSAVREQLDARGWTAHLANDPLPALAELCLLERLDATRRAWGRPCTGLALVVVKPSRWPELQAMLAAARRYVPAAGIWAFDNGTLTPLAGGSDSDNGAGRQAAPNAPSPQSYEMQGVPEARNDDPGSPQITGDEISMLLDGNFRDQQTPEDDEALQHPDDEATGGKPPTDPEA